MIIIIGLENLLFKLQLHQEESSGKEVIVSG